MAHFIGISAILLLFFGVAVQGVQLGANCTVTANCTSTVPHSDCTGTSTKTCTCVAGYVAKSNNAKCLVKINGTCDNTTATECLPNAACTNSRCMCNMNFQPSANGMECNSYLQNVQLGGNCTGSASCIVTNSACTGTSTKTCSCVAGYVAKSDNAKCLVKINETCDNTTATECLPNAACTNSRCMCNVNFQPSDDGIACIAGNLTVTNKTKTGETPSNRIAVIAGVTTGVVCCGMMGAAGVVITKKVMSRKTAVSSCSVDDIATAKSNGPQSQTSEQPQAEESETTQYLID